jgi:hypothetical protein
MDAGHIHPLFPPRLGFEHWWARDRTLTEWVTEINEILAVTPPDISGDTILSASDVQLPSVAALHPPGYGMAVAELFHEIQRHRYLARKVLNRLRLRAWARRIQCNVDLIDMEPIPVRDQILLTDTTNRTIYAFHRRDIFQNLLSNIGAAAEMLPAPRLPTNPWTNSPLTPAQTISLCQKLLLDYAQRGKCPPVLFAAFCAAKYDIHHFESENSAMLAQHAIRAYFADLHEHNREVVTDTVTQLLDEHGVHFSPITVRRWFRRTPVTSLHREWLALARDYTLHLNLHIQPRPSWHDDAGIARDVRRLYAQTDFSDAVSPRLRLLRGDASGAQISVTMRPDQITMVRAGPGPLLGLFDPADTLASMDTPLLTGGLMPILFTTAAFASQYHAAATPDILDPSGNPISSAEALALLRSTLWRM